MRARNQSCRNIADSVEGRRVALGLIASVQSVIVFYREALCQDPRQGEANAENNRQRGQQGAHRTQRAQLRLNLRVGVPAIVACNGRDSA